MKNKYGVIIQGPLHSFGRTGRTANITAGKVKSKDVVTYLAIPNIINYFERFRDLVEIVCVVWDDEECCDIDFLGECVGPENIKIIKDETQFIPAREGLVSGNNKYRQFFSVLKGLEFLKGRAISHVIKVRSDQEVNIGKLIEDYENAEKHRDNFMLVPRLIRNAPDNLADFYFCGEINLFESLLKSYLKNEEIFSHVHTDIFYRWSRCLVGKPWFPYKLSGSSLFEDYINKAWRQGFCPASRMVYSDLRWRGEKIVNLSDESMFIEDLQPDFRVGATQLNPRPSILKLFLSKLKCRVLTLSSGKR